MGINQFKAILIRAVILACCWTSGIGYLSAQTNNSYPMLMSLRPVAAQIGQSTEHELNARYNLAGATAVVVSGAGVSGQIIPNDQEKPEDRNKNDVMASKCRLRFVVDRDAVPGVRDFRIITPHGASTIGQLVVGREPVVQETSDNDTRATAQAVTLPANLCGAIEKAEDVDYFKFHVPAGSDLVFHVRSQRLMNRLHDMQTRIDPIISLRTDSGAVVASSDNFYAGDPLLHYHFDREGDYFLEIRDVRYQGNADWTYSLEVSSRPYITQVFPPVVRSDASCLLQCIGPNISTSYQTHVPLVGHPLHPFSDLKWMSGAIGEIATNEFGVLVTTDPIVIESQSPNVDATTSTDGTPKSTPSITSVPAIPAVLTGRIAHPGEVDLFSFEAKANEKLAVEVIARRLNSGLDPIIRILNEQSSPLVESDDATFQRVGNADSWLESWTAPADGKYRLEIRDLHQRGGPQCTYAIKLSRPEPGFLLELDCDKTLLAPGMSSCIFVKILRKNGFSGEVQLDVEGLPSGVTAVAGRIPSDVTDGCVYLTANSDAPLSHANIQIVGNATRTNSDGSTTPLRVLAQPLQEYYSPGGGRGHYPVDMHTVSVASPMDIRSIEVSTREVVLAPGGSQKLDVKIERAPDFKGNVTLDVVMQHLEQHFGNSLPKGVRVDVAASKTLLTANENQGHITLAASADAPPIEQQLVPVNVHVSINFVMKHTLCGGPLSVSVRKP